MLVFFLLILGLLCLLLGIFFERARFGSFYTNALIVAIVIILLYVIDLGPSQEEIKLFSGTYVVDTTGSEFPRQLMSQYADLTLTVNKDLTFEINRPSPFFTSTKGTWDYDGRSEFGGLTYKFEGSAVEHENFFRKSDEWKLATDDSKRRTIIFKRVTK